MTMPMNWYKIGANIHGPQMTNPFGYLLNFHLASQASQNYNLFDEISHQLLDGRELQYI